MSTEAPPRTRHLSSDEATRLLINFGEAYALGQKERGLPDREHVELVRLTERLLQRLTGNEASLDDIAAVRPY